MKRFELFRALTGSHNYNLNHENSDRDYKVFIVPSYKDLYYKSDAHSKSHHGEYEDFDYHDVRNLVYRMSKANVNFIEVLFSEEIIINPNLPIWAKYAVSQLIDLKDDIAKMNLPYLYDACLGMKANKMKLLDNGNKETKHLVDKYGYDTKAAMTSYRILNFLIRFADNNFTDFKKAIWYDKNDNIPREILNGFFNKEEIVMIIENKERYIKENYKEIYKSKPYDFKTEEAIEKLMQNLIRHSIILMD